MPASKRFSVSVNPLLLHYVVAVVISVTVLSGMFRHFILDWSDPLHCGALLKEGQWLDDKFNNWQPEGCMAYNYSPGDVSTCLASRQIIFIGDSVTRQLFFTLAHLADPDLPSQPPNDNQKHSDHALTSKYHTQFAFVWDPYLNSTKTNDILHSNDNSTASDSASASIRKPAMLVLGTGMWFLRYSEASGGLPRWEATIESALDLIKEADGRLADTVIFLPVEEVTPSKLSTSRATTIRNSDVDAMNSDLMHRIDPPSTHPIFAPLEGSNVPSLPGVAFPQAFNEMLDPSQTSDGLHYSTGVLKAQANVLLNYRCNEVLPKEFPLDKTCCRKYPSASFHQLFILFVLSSWGLIARWAAPELSRRPRLQAIFPRDDHIMPLSIFGLAVLLAFIADRTPIWLKEQKQYNPWVFGAWCVFSLLAGLLSVRRADKDLGFLNREQTDEWKGWMQIFILIYHYFGASKISGIYNPIRVLVAAYLFMSGYGHTTFYMKKADYGLLRVAQVMVRLNLLPIALAYVMNTNYLSYYFSPLVSMWFLIIYATMAVGKSLNDRSTFLVMKFLISMAIVTAFMNEAWMLEGLFTWLERLCGIRWSAAEWAFRVKLDLWIVYLGMFTALAYIKCRELHLLDHHYWPFIYRMSVGASGLVLVWFFVFELSQPSKFAYNAWHPYLSFLPIIAFVILRNANPILRSASSRVFAFIGACSLETFIIQFHFWMAADTKGILLVIPGTDWRPLNMVISTAIFIWISHQVAGATGELTNWFCGIPKKTLPTSAATRPVTGTSGPEEIPLAVGNKNEEAPRSPEPDTPGSTQRWVDRLANGSRTSGYRIFDGSDDSSLLFRCSPGVGTKLIVTAFMLWIVNITWPSEHITSRL